MTTILWNDFNSAEDQDIFEPIPRGTLVKVKMNIRPGGYSDESQGWDSGYATKSPSTGAIYLNCEFVVLRGPYAKRKVWALIGLYSPKGPEWTKIGRTFIKGILNSAHGLKPQDNSAFAKKVRFVNSVAQLDGAQFVAQVDTEKNSYGEDKNIIRKAITPLHKDYAEIMGSAPASTNQRIQTQTQPLEPTHRPNWAA